MPGAACFRRVAIGTIKVRPPLLGHTMGNNERDVAELLSRAVHDTLDVLVAPSIRHSLVREALRSSGLQEIPATVTAVHEFIEGPLLAAASKAFGPELAASVAEEIVRVFNDAQGEVCISTVAPTEPPPRNTPLPPSSGRLNRRIASPVPPPRRTLSPRPAPHSYVRRQAIAKSRSNPGVTPSEYFRRVAGGDRAGTALEPAPLPLLGRPRVFAATRDTALLEALTGWLGEQAELVRIRSVFQLVRILEATQNSANVLMLDCLAPSIRPTAVAALADELGLTQVVLCRPIVEVEQELAAVSATTKAWMRLYDREHATDIAAWCLELVS